MKTMRAGLMIGAAALALGACGRTAGRPEAEVVPEEVSIGYDTRPKGDLTGAISSVSGEELGDARPLQIEEYLQGRVAGLQVVRLSGGNFAFRIRGTTSLRPGREQDALVIVDDVMIPDHGLRSALAGLIPQDIKRIDVLKDVASTSIYGMRGAGGVIVITTNRK